VPPETPSIEDREQAWWDAWRAADYSWAGLGLKRIGRRHGLRGEQTLQDYWRRHPATGACRDDNALREAGELIDDPDGVAWHIAHVPMRWSAERPAKATWNKARFERLFAVMAARLAEAEATSPETPDGRAQFTGAVCPALSSLAVDHTGSLHLICDQAWLPDWNVSGVKFGPGVSFNGAAFSGTVNFRRASFAGDAHFKRTSFVGPASFYRTEFGGSARFDGAFLGGYARFEGACFDGDTCFDNAVFASDADFLRGAFRGPASFDHASIAGEASFASASFAQVAHFPNAAFAGSAEFKNTTFIADAHFSGASFAEKAGFFGASFEACAAFDGASFAGPSYFYEAVLGQDADFQGATWAEDAVFNHTRFLGDAIFGHTEFSGEASFDRASFSRRMSFFRAVFLGRTSFSHVIWPSAARDWHGGFEQSRFIDWAEFDGTAFNALAAFADAEFGRGAKFDEDQERNAKKQFELQRAGALEAARADAWAAAGDGAGHAELRAAELLRLGELERGCRALRLQAQAASNADREKLLHRFEAMAHRAIEGR
jgi:hypothetical protein